MPGELHDGVELEREGDPGRPLARLQRHGLAPLRLDPQAPAVGEDRERHRDLDDRRLAEELVVGAEDLGLDRPDVRLEADELDGELVLVSRREERVRRVVARRADPPPHVGDAEAGEEAPLVVVDGRKGDRNVEDDRLDPLRPGHLPERRPLPVVLDGLERLGEESAEAPGEEAGGRGEDERDDGGRDGLLQREPAEGEDEEEGEERSGRRGARPVPAAEEKVLLPLGGDGELRAVGLRVALEEVEDLRPARGEPGRERRPGDGGLGRNRRAEGARSSPAARASPGSGASPRRGTARRGGGRRRRSRGRRRAP